MASDQGPVVQSALLRAELTRLRRERELTQEQVASRLEWSASKLIRVEGGKSAITKVDLDALLDVYGVSSESQRDRLQSMNRGARQQSWWNRYKADLDPTFLNYVGYEAGASFIRSFSPLVLPGLLQTRRYARRVSAEAIDDDPRQVERAVEFRMLRQSEMAKRTPPPRRYFILDEACIWRRVGIREDREIMPEQLRYIADRAQADERLTVRVIPFSAGAHVGMSGQFTLLEFDGGLPDLLYIEAGLASTTLVSGDIPQIVECADSFERLLGDALSAADSIEFIRTVAVQMSDLIPL